MSDEKEFWEGLYDLLLVAQSELSEAIKQLQYMQSTYEVIDKKLSKKMIDSMNKEIFDK